MSESIKGRTALITGSAQRIGREIALLLADEGANAIVHYRNSADEANELVGLLKKRGVEAWSLQADFENQGSESRLIEDAFKTAGALDILVNNAAMFPSDNLQDLTFESLEQNVRVNAWGPFALSRAFAEKVEHGKIVNLLDSRIKGYDWMHVGYILSKHVLAVLTRMMALKYAPGIAVNAVAPGLILPPPGKDESYLDALTDTVPLKKHGDPQDVADAVVYLAKSRFLTGEVIYVDGGRHLKEYISEHKSEK